jgi:LPS export ABC transporter protein LptC
VLGTYDRVSLSDQLPRRAALHLIGATWLCSCAAFAPPPPLAPPPDLTFHEVTLEEFKNGRLTHRGTASNLQYVRDNGHITGEDAEMLPLSGTMSGGTLTASFASGSTKTGQMQLSDGVHWTASSGDEADTSSCAVDLPGQVAVGHDPVSLTGSGYRVDANAFESHFAHSGELLLSGGVHTTVLESDVVAGSKAAAQ